MRQNSASKIVELQPQSHEPLELPEVPGSKVYGSQIVKPLQQTFKRQQKRFNMYIEQAHSSIDMKNSAKMHSQVAQLNGSNERRQNLSSAILENPPVRAEIQPSAANISLSCRKNSEKGKWHLNRVKSTQNSKGSITERTQEVAKAYANTNTQVTIKKELGRRAQSDANSDYHQRANHPAARAQNQHQQQSERGAERKQLAEVTEESKMMRDTSQAVGLIDKSSLIEKNADYTASVTITSQIQFVCRPDIIAIDEQGRVKESHDYSVKLPEIGCFTKSQAAIPYNRSLGQESVLSGLNQSLKKYGPLSIHKKQKHGSSEKSSAINLIRTSSNQVISKHRQVQTVSQQHNAKVKLLRNNPMKSSLLQADQAKSYRNRQGLTAKGPVRQSTTSIESRLSRASVDSKESRQQLHLSKTGSVDNQNLNLIKKKSSQVLGQSKQMQQVMQLYLSDSNQKNQMKHQSVFTDKAAVGTSPSAGPTLNRKSQIQTNQRFPSSHHMGKNYSPNTKQHKYEQQNEWQQYTAQIATYTNSQEGLPQIVSPKIASSNNKLDMRTQHTSGLMMTASSQLKSTKPTSKVLNVLDSQNNPQILHQSNECSARTSNELMMPMETPIVYEHERGAGLKSVSRRGDSMHRNIVSPLSAIPDQKNSPRSRGTQGKAFREKKTMQPISINETTSLHLSNRTGSPSVVIQSPVNRGSEQILMENSALSMPTQNYDLSQVSPRQFKNNPYIPGKFVITSAG